MSRLGLYLGFTALMLAACGGGDSTSTVANPATPAARANSPAYTIRSDAPSYRFRGKRTGKVEAVMVPVRDADGNERALIQFSKGGPEGTPYVLEREVSERGVGFYQIVWHGRERVLLSEPPPDRKWASWLLMGHFESESIEVRPSDVKATELLAQHQRMAASGELERIAKFERRFWIDLANDKLAAAKVRVEGACGRLEARIDWSRVPDAHLGEVPHDGACVDGFLSLIEVCKRGPSERQAVAAAGTFVCRPNGALDEEQRKMTTTGKATVARDLLLYEPHYQNTRRRAPVAIMAALRIDREVLPVGNGYLVVGNTSNYPNAGPVLIGDGKRFRPHPRGKLLFQGGPVLWAGHTNAVVTRLTATEWEIQCGQRSRKVAELAPGQRDRILAAASFNDEVPWKREPHSLARDTRGTYYFVDRYRKEHGGRHFRVFIGRRGAMKLSRLKNVVNDTKGTIFSTQRGELRLVVDDDGDGTAVWIRGRRRTRLTTVPLSKNLEFIYGELGVYLGQKLGHVCEL